MSAGPARRAVTMTLAELVALYRKAAAKFGAPVPISAFGLPSGEISKILSGFDEDYHISRFFRFSNGDGTPVSVNGVPVTHLSLDPEIESIL